MKKKQFLVLLIAVMACAQLSYSQSKKELKKSQQLKEYKATKKIVEDGMIVFKAQTMTPYLGSNTTVIGDGILIEENFLHVNLPFMGNFTAGFTSNDSNIEFSTDDTIFEVIYNDKKQKIKINFEVQNKTETFTFNIAIYRNGRTAVQITSNMRSRMNYEGTIEATPQIAKN